MINFNCPKCGGQLSVPDGMAGASKTCGACSNVTVVPSIAITPPVMAAAYPAYGQQAAQPTGKATTSLVLGLVGLLAWILPLVGFPVTIVGLVMGVKGLRSPAKGMATAGVILCIVGLVATVINSAIGAYLGATGQLGR